VLPVILSGVGKQLGLGKLDLCKLGWDFCAGAENSVGPILQIILTK